MKDGWHIVKGYEVYVENNTVLRGVLGDGNNRKVAYPYKLDKKQGCYVNAVGVKVNTFSKSELYVLK